MASHVEVCDHGGSKQVLPNSCEFLPRYPEYCSLVELAVQNQSQAFQCVLLTSSVFSAPLIFIPTPTS